MGKRKEKQTRIEPVKEVKAVRNWRIGDYIRQLSIVVLGIVITFMGSDLISNYAKQREVRASMLLIKSELEENQKEIRDVREKWKRDCSFCLLLQKEGFQYHNIPRDTLIKYKSTLTSVWGVSYVTDALDVLKSSGLLQYVSDKKFVYKLTELYQKIREVEKSVVEIGALKVKMWDALDTKGMSLEEEKTFYDGDLLDMYRVYLSIFQVRSFIRMLPYYFDSDIFAEADEAIQEMIQTIEEKYE